MSPQQLGGAAKHVCPNLIVKNCINSGIVCSFFFLLFFFLRYKTSGLCFERMSERASPGVRDSNMRNWKMMWQSRVCSNIHQNNHLIYVITEMTVERETNTNKSLTELPLKNSNLKRFCSSNLLQCFWSVIIHVWWASDIDSVVGSSSEGWFASGGKKLYSAVRKRGEKN